MEIRVLRYFIAVAQTENITKAASVLNVTQPTLSRQLTKLEEELGSQLLIRGKRKVTLTEDGKLLLQRAEEIITIADKTEKEFDNKNEQFSGEIMIGSIEGTTSEILSQALTAFNNKFPQVSYNIFSGTGEEIKEKIDKGIIDLGIVLEPINLEKYDYFKINSHEIWGVLAPSNSYIAKKDNVSPVDLINIPLMSPSRPFIQKTLSQWFGSYYEDVNIIVKYNLIFNTANLVENGLGYALCMKGVTNTVQSDSLVFVPLNPPMYSEAFVIWRKHKIFTPASRELLQYVKHLKIV